MKVNVIALFNFEQLARELKSLEANRLIIKAVYDTFPPNAEYSITEHGKPLEKVMDELHHWGLSQRQLLIGK